MYEKLGLGAFSYRVFSVNPDLKMACDAAIQYLGNNFPGESRSLLSEMILDAFTAYREAEKMEINARHAFIRGLCKRAIYLYKIRYCNSDLQSNVVWTPMQVEVSVFESMNENSIVILQEPDPQNVDDATALIMFAARILPSHLYKEVFQPEFIYAKAS